MRPAAPPGLEHHLAAGTDDPLIDYSGAGASLGYARFLYGDARGSIVYRSDSANTSNSANTYDEYGQPGSSNIGRFQYTGQAWLAELGMYYYKARVYSPRLGRFMQTDPIGYDDQINLYAYVANDPVNGVDPTGLCTGSRITKDGSSSGECASGGFVAGTGYCSGNCSPSSSTGLAQGQSSPGRGSVLGNSTANASSDESWSDYFGRKLREWFGDNENPITETPRPVSAADFGPTTGGVVVVRGSIWADRRASTVGVYVDYVEATGFGRGGGGFINQSVDTLVGTAREQGLSRIEIVGVMGNRESQMFLRGMRALPYKITSVDSGVYTYISITGF